MWTMVEKGHWDQPNIGSVVRVRDGWVGANTPYPDHIFDVTNTGVVTSKKKAMEGITAIIQERFKKEMGD